MMETEVIAESQILERRRCREGVEMDGVVE